MNAPVLKWPDLTDDDLELLRRYCLLSPENRQKVQAVVCALCAEQDAELCAACAAIGMQDFAEQIIGRWNAEAT